MEQTQFEKEVMELNKKITENFVYFVQERSSRFHIPPFQLQVLLYLDEHEFSVSELSKQLYMAKSNMSTLLKSMEKDGYLLRTRCSEDERRTTITLSDKGKKIVEEYHKSNHRNDFAHIDADENEQKTIIDGLEKLLELLEKARYE